ncbi:MAG: hypothetical protein KH828_00560 [Clostridiales bacterium]|nr:hypothetical protein [Clostridiales bacterium]
MKLYEKNREKKLSKALFENPTSEYRGTPFWAWNCKITPEHIRNGYAEMKEMGMGGAHLHCRTGMDVPYLSEEFMDLVTCSLEEAKKQDMLLWLYDEDRWPSGFGGGYVTRDHKYRSRFLVFSPEDLDKKYFQPTYISGAQAVRNTERDLLQCYGVKIVDGWLADYCLLEKDQEPPVGYTKWYAYKEVSGDNPWFNNQAYLDTLNPEAVKKFIEITHEKYAETVGADFGKRIPSIFTDEPQFCHKGRMGYSLARESVIIPYTDDLEETFCAAYGHSLLEKLPEVFWELGEDEVSETRYQYHDHVCQRFTEAYAVQIGKWCQEHGLRLTGHMMEEPTLMSQTAALGEAMRSYKGFDIPGIDMLCDSRELSTVKQAQSAVHQYGREGMLSELYGVTNWDFDFRGHKLQGDWQAALGVTVRVPHLNWVSMAGEAKRDYPAAIGYQSPWYKEYKMMEDHFARVNTAITRGTPVVKVGVIHPVESYWLYWGTEEKTSVIRKELEEGFHSVIDWLLYGLQDFDFISEALFPEQTELGQITEGKLPVGEMKYDAVIVPNCVTLRKTTVERLEKFREQGGKVIFTGKLPKYMDAKKDDRPVQLAEKCLQVPFVSSSIMENLEEYRLVEVKDERGIRHDNMIYQMRQDGENRWLFLVHVEPMRNRDMPHGEHNTITLKGNWKITLYDTFSGETREIHTENREGNTSFTLTMFEHDSLLLYMEPIAMEEIGCKEDGEQMTGSEKENEGADQKRICIIPEKPMDYVLSEPNVCLLDMAEYRFDDGEWQSREEVLRIDNQFRELLGYPLRMEAYAQPWTDQEDCPYEHRLTLKFTVYSEVSLKDLHLALEDASDVEIQINGNHIASEADGWYTDRDIKTVPIGSLCKGSNEIQVSIPYNRKRNIEAMYLLGEFGVWVAGSVSVLKEKPAKLMFGDITRQGFPFYGGNVTYDVPVNLPEGEAAIQISRFRSPLLKVEMDGKEMGPIALSPYVVSLGKVTEGEHRLKITSFGNRVNTFGAIHNCNEVERWFGPNAWRTTGEQWSYEYFINETGILKAPEISVDVKK